MALPSDDRSCAAASQCRATHIGDHHVCAPGLSGLGWCSAGGMRRYAKVVQFRVHAAGTRLRERRHAAPDTSSSPQLEAGSARPILDLDSGIYPHGDQSQHPRTWRCGTASLMGKPAAGAGEFLHAVCQTVAIRAARPSHRDRELFPSRHAKRGSMNVNRPYLLLVSLAISIGSAWGGPSTDGNELRFCIGAQPKTFNPLLVDDDASETVRYLTGGVLLRLDRNSQKLLPELAKGWTINPTGNAITFTLRENVRFSDGTPFSAEDVAYTMQKLMDPGLHS